MDYQDLLSCSLGCTHIYNSSYLVLSMFSLKLITLLNSLFRIIIEPERLDATKPLTTNVCP
jgi:hypothetical protein